MPCLACDVDDEMDRGRLPRGFSHAGVGRAKRATQLRKRANDFMFARPRSGRSPGYPQTTLRSRYLPGEDQPPTLAAPFDASGGTATSSEPCANRLTYVSCVRRSAVPLPSGAWREPPVGHPATAARRRKAVRRRRKSLPLCVPIDPHQRPLWRECLAARGAARFQSRDVEGDGHQCGPGHVHQVPTCCVVRLASTANHGLPCAGRQVEHRDLRCAHSAGGSHPLTPGLLACRYGSRQSGEPRAARPVRRRSGDACSHA
jgi:hypothetical protein